MQEWFETLTTFEKIFWYIAIPFSLIFIIQLILTFAGMDGHSSDVPAEGHDLGGHDSGSDSVSPGFSFFTLRNFIAFFTIFGWTGIAAVNSGAGKTTTIVLAIVCGIIAMLLISTLFYFIFRLAESGNANAKNAVGKSATVYIPVKAKRGNTGKVQVAFEGSLREMPAITDGEEDLSTGAQVMVSGITDHGVLIIEKTI